MALNAITTPNVRPAAPSPGLIFRYVLLACLFAASVSYQVTLTILILRQGAGDFPAFSASPGSAAIAEVEPRAAAAGLHKGDILVAVNGRPYTGSSVLWEEAAKAPPGSTMKVTVRSPAANGAQRTVYIPTMASQHWAALKAAFVAISVVMPVFCIALGFWVVLARPGDRLAWLLLGLSLSFTQVASAYPMFAIWGPGILTLTVAYNVALKFTWPVFMFLFGFYFPEPLPYFMRPGLWRKWLPWMVVAPYALLATVLWAVIVADIRSYSALQPLQPVIGLIEKITSVYVFCLVSAFFSFIFTKSSMSISPDAKRRLRLLYWGATLALTPLLLVGLLVWIKPSMEPPDWIIGLLLVMFLIFPLTLAYVIVVQRAMDVRVVVRQGLQYALAKNGVRVLQVLAILVVTLTALALIGQNRERPQKLIVIALGLLAIFTIRRMTEKTGAWLDRRFFREAYDAEQVFSELSDSVRGMVEARSLIETVAERISETLHIPRVAILLGGVGAYRPAYALGYGAVPDIAFPPSAGTVKLLQKESEPARVYFDDPDSWLYREPEITEEDRSKLTKLDAALLLPLSTRDKLLGFISLGPKLSDEPYSRADLRLLKSVAAQTGLALENAQLISEIADEVAQRERLNREVEIAREVQERLFPQTLPPIAGIAYAGACRSALGVGGDYYDFLALPAGKLGIAIGDVSGKGIAAALMMASLQASLRSEATRASDNLAAMMGNVNRLVYEASSSNRYATFFYGQYDPLSRQLTYVNAGHNPPMLFQPRNGECHVSRLEACGTVVGLLDDASYQQATTAIAPGDVLIAFTDGISEAMNATEDEWGEEQIDPDRSRAAWGCRRPRSLPASCGPPIPSSPEPSRTTT